MNRDDLDAARELLLSHLRFVVHVARGYNGYGLQMADLIQEGNIGLMKAVKRFDPSVGVRLVSFAVHWIRAEMHEFIIKNWRIVKVATTKAQRKLFFNLRRSKTRLGWLNAEEVRAVAKDLNVSEREVLEMESRLSGRDIGFDAPDDADDDHAPPAPAAYLMAEGLDPAQTYESADSEADQLDLLREGLARLDQRSARHRQAPLARTRQQGHAAGTRRRVWRVRRAHPPDRSQCAEEDEGAVRGLIRAPNCQCMTTARETGPSSFAGNFHSCGGITLCPIPAMHTRRACRSDGHSDDHMEVVHDREIRFGSDGRRPAVRPCVGLARYRTGRHVSNATLGCYVDTYAYDYITDGRCDAWWTPWSATNPSVVYLEVGNLPAGTYSFSWAGQRHRPGRLPGKQQQLQSLDRCIHLGQDYRVRAGCPDRRDETAECRRQLSRRLQLSRRHARR